MIKPEKKDVAPFLQDYKEYHTDVSVNFEVKLSEVRVCVCVFLCVCVWSLLVLDL